MNPEMIAVVGLGYVGWPIATALADHYSVVGYDICPSRVEQISGLVAKDLNIKVTSKFEDVAPCSVFIICVPTPIDKNNKPDLSSLTEISLRLSRVIQRSSIVIYESTVFPGCTEDVCIPALESESELIAQKDFYVGYSPERIDPGDNGRGLSDIAKIVACPDSGALAEMLKIYGSIIDADLVPTSIIKEAEAAKVLENTQRDINVALINEFAFFCGEIGLKTKDVLKLAKTKWNFLDFYPGLVGGHCIGVDPYYLANKAMEIGLHPEVTLAGRRVNESVAEHIANTCVRRAIQQSGGSKLRALVIGATFKEDCDDLRNSQVKKMVKCLLSWSIKVDLRDIRADSKALEMEYGDISVGFEAEESEYEIVIYAVPHRENLVALAASIFEKTQSGSVIFDIRGVLREASLIEDFIEGDRVYLEF